MKNIIEKTKEYFKNLNPTVKRYLLSSAVTFVSAFAFLIGGAIQEISLDTITIAAVISLVLAAIRGAFKALAESYLEETGDK